MFLSTLAAICFAGAISTGFECVKPQEEFPEVGVSKTETFGPFDAGFSFNEAIASWNVDNSAAASLVVQARVMDGNVVSKWYTLGDWSGDAKLHPRVSVTGQGDDTGDVATDTLRLKRLCSKIQLQVTMTTLAAGPRPKLKFIGLNLSDTSATLPDGATVAPAWGKELDVPQRAQNDYPNGGVLCSPTSLSMVLWHYSNKLNRPELNQDVPVVEENVWDSVYKGAGNWPFNTAYAGSFYGMRSYVTRFRDISDLEMWIGLDFPVICSVSFDLLRGKPLSTGEQGHLIVLAGFTPTGDVIVNDPAFKDQVRKTYPRSDFEKAWLYSHRTVYLVYPEGSHVPNDNTGPWEGMSVPLPTGS